MPNTTFKSLMREILAEHPRASAVYQRNVLKEYLQVVVLDFIYSHPRYQDLFFYGGSSLAQCYGLPRLSEDLDFVDLSGKIKHEEIANDLKNYFDVETNLKVKILTQKFRVYLKFSILKELGLAGGSDSDLLFLKVEVFPGKNFCKGYKTEVIPLFKHNRSILVKTFDLPTLFATKLGAVLNRVWLKKSKDGTVLARVKGRDFFDLMWYLDKGVKPNMECVVDVKTIMELKKKLVDVVSKIDEPSIRLDLEPLIADTTYVAKLGKNLKAILLREIDQKL